MILLTALAAVAVFVVARKAIPQQPRANLVPIPVPVEKQTKSDIIKGRKS